MTKVLCTTGDDVAQAVPLKRDGAAFAITATSAKAALVDWYDKTVTRIAETAIDLVATGTDLPNGIVVVEFTAAQTAALESVAPLEVELQVKLIDATGFEETYHNLEEPYYILRGHIS